MKTPNNLQRLFSLFVTASLLGSSLSLASPLTGDYGARGVKIAGNVGEGATHVSLQALLRLQFDPVLGMADHQLNSTAEFVEDEHGLTLTLRDSEGQQLERMFWRRDAGFDVVGDLRRVAIPGARPQDAALVFLFERIEDGRLLRLEVVRLAATNFGPVPASVGTYLFYTLP